VNKYHRRAAELRSRIRELRKILNQLKRERLRYTLLADGKDKPTFWERWF